MKELKLHLVTISFEAEVYVLAEDDDEANEVAEENLSDITTDVSEGGFHYHATEVTKDSDYLASWENAIPFSPSGADDDMTVGKWMAKLKDAEAGEPTQGELESLGQANLIEVANA